MTDRQENKLSMYLATNAVLGANNTTWAGVPAFVISQGLFNDKISAISKARQIQETETTGVTEDKAQAREAAVVKATVVAAGVFAYASFEDNNTLKEQVNYSPSELRRSRDTILADRLRLIFNTANDNAAAILDYGISAADLIELDDLTTAYEELLQSPRQAIGERSTAKQELEQLFTDGDKILKEQIDKLMELYRTTEVTFYNKYKSARVIIDLGKGGGSDPEEPTPPVED